MSWLHRRCAFFVPACVFVVGQGLSATQALRCQAGRHVSSGAAQSPTLPSSHSSVGLEGCTAASIAHGRRPRQRSGAPRRAAGAGRRRPGGRGCALARASRWRRPRVEPLRSATSGCRRAGRRLPRCRPGRSAVLPGAGEVPRIALACNHGRSLRRRDAADDARAPSPARTTRTFSRSEKTCGAVGCARGWSSKAAFEVAYPLRIRLGSCAGGTPRWIYGASSWPER